MSMFDTVHVAKSLIEAAIKDLDVKLPPPENGYYLFQTKDLDNFLDYFFIEEDSSFYYKEQQYIYVPSDPNNKAKKLWNVGHMEPVGDPKMVLDTRTAYIDFYDSFTTDLERIFITFTAHLKEGKLKEITNVNIERTNLKEEQERNSVYAEQWERVNATWQWKVATAISNVRWKIQKIFSPITRRLDKLEQSLREEAKKQNGIKI